MADKASIPAKLTDEQKTQYQSVIEAAERNIDLVIDQLSSIDRAELDLTVDSLDNAKAALGAAKSQLLK